MIEGMRGAGGRIIPYVLQCVACGSVWVGGYLHGPPKPCGSQHRLSGNRAPSSQGNGSRLVWKPTCPEPEVLIKSHICIALQIIGQGKSQAIHICCSLADSDYAHHGVVGSLQLKVVVRKNTAIIVNPVHSELCSWDGPCRRTYNIPTHVRRHDHL